MLSAERLLTLKEAAEVLRLHPRIVREYIRRGELQGRLIGRRWRLRRKDLDSFFEKAPTGWLPTRRDAATVIFLRLLEEAT